MVESGIGSMWPSLTPPIHRFRIPMSLRSILSFVVFLSPAVIPCTYGQTDDPLTESAETRYYDFWPGIWAEEVDGVPDTTATRFRVVRSVNPAAYVEHWIQVYDGGEHRSIALPGWDQVQEKWLFTWVSDNGLFQMWDGRKIDGHWYIVKEFTINGTHLISRQAWIPEGPDRLIRVMERSFDNGETWETRSRTPFRRIQDR